MSTPRIKRKKLGYHSITEAARVLGVPRHILRFAIKQKVVDPPTLIPPGCTRPVYTRTDMAKLKELFSDE